MQFYFSVDSLSMLPTTTRPARIARTFCTLLDTFLITDLRNFKAGMLSIEIIDHLPIFLIYNRILIP